MTKSIIKATQQARETALLWGVTPFITARMLVDIRKQHQNAHPLTKLYIYFQALQKTADWLSIPAGIITVIAACLLTGYIDWITGQSGTITRNLLWAMTATMGLIAAAAVAIGIQASFMIMREAIIRLIQSKGALQVEYEIWT